MDTNIMQQAKEYAESTDLAPMEIIRLAMRTFGKSERYKILVKRKKFSDHLGQASKIVDAWPDWKKKYFGVGSIRKRGDVK